MKAVVTSLFIVLLLLSVVYAYERILFADASFILFRIINSGSLQIQELRFGSFITQWIPLLAARLHLSLTLIVFLYSASFNLFYLTVALLLLFVFREISLAMLMSLYYVLFVSDTFYWANNEVHQGIAWLFLAIAVFNYLYNKKASLVVLLFLFLFLMSLAIFTHPLIMLPALFLWLSLLSEHNIWQKDKNKALLFSIILMIICFLKIPAK